jgi:hypothetical protein
MIVSAFDKKESKIIIKAIAILCKILEDDDKMGEKLGVQLQDIYTIARKMGVSDPEAHLFKK